MPLCSVPNLGIELQTVAAQTSEEVRGAPVFPPDFRMVYNHAYGIPASRAGRFPLVGNYTTTTRLLKANPSRLAFS